MGAESGLFPMTFISHRTIFPRCRRNGSTGPTYLRVSRRPIVPVFCTREIPRAGGGRWLWNARSRSQSREMRRAAFDKMSGAVSSCRIVLSFSLKETDDEAQPVKTENPIDKNRGTRTKQCRLALSFCPVRHFFVPCIIYMVHPATPLPRLNVLLESYKHFTWY